MTQKAKAETLKKFEFRKTAIDTINSNRSIYFLGFYPLYILVLSVLFYICSLSILYSLLFVVLFPIYLCYCYRFLDKIKNFMKKIRHYVLSKPTIEALEAGRRSLKVQIKESIGLN